VLLLCSAKLCFSCVCWFLGVKSVNMSSPSIGFCNLFLLGSKYVRVILAFVAVLFCARCLPLPYICIELRIEMQVQLRLCFCFCHKNVKKGLDRHSHSVLLMNTGSSCFSLSTTNLPFFITLSTMFTPKR